MSHVRQAETEFPSERLEVTIKRVHEALAGAGLQVAGELLLPPENGQDTRSTLLLVSCPVLDFEATAVVHSVAAFLPLHLLVDEAGGRTRISFFNPASMFDGRLPPGASGPMERLGEVVARALRSLR